MGLGSHRSPCSVSAFETTGDSTGAGARILRLFEQAVMLRDAGLRPDWGDMTGCKTLMLVALTSLVARGGDGGDDSSTDSVAPAATVAATTTGAPETGRVWNRVQTLGGEDEFLLETSVAMATVRGAAFVVECLDVDPSTFTALESNDVLITQKDLASISGAVRPTVNRAVNDLPGGQGVALPRNLPPIVDAVRFAELAGQG